MKYDIQEHLKPRGLTGISDEQIEQHWHLYEGYVKNTNELLGEIETAERVRPVGRHADRGGDASSGASRATAAHRVGRADALRRRERGAAVKSSPSLLWGVLTAALAVFAVTLGAAFGALWWSRVMSLAEEALLETSAVALLAGLTAVLALCRSLP